MHASTAGRSVGGGDVCGAWCVDAVDRLTVEVTDGGGVTRPAAASASLGAHHGRGLDIVSVLADDWGVRDGSCGEVTVWAVVEHARSSADGHRTDGKPPCTAGTPASAVPDLGFASA